MLKVKIENTDKFDIEAYQYNAEIMGEVNLSCDVYLNVALDYFDLDMYVNINGENLYLSSFEPTGVKNTDNIYPKYSLIFESKRVQLKRKYFRDLTGETEAGIDWEAEYAFYGNIADFATRFQKNLTKYFLNNEWSIEVYGDHSQDVSVLFEASNLYLFDALKQMSETWDKEWKIVSSETTNVIQVGFPQETLDHNFEYEGGNAGGGLTVIQKEVDTSNIITRMLSAGSTKNIPYQYFRQLSASELEAGNEQDPNVAPLFSNGYYNLMPKCFREYISGYNYQSFGIGTSAWIKGRADFNAGIYNPITYYEKNINTWGEREGIVEVNEDIFPTITDVEIEGIGMIDEVVDVEQISFNSQEIQNNYYDGANIISDLGEILNEFKAYIPFTTPNNDYSFIRYTDSIALLNTQQIVFNYKNYYGFELIPTNKIVTSKLIIQREQSAGVWIDVHEYITVADNKEWLIYFADSYVFEKDFVYQTSISGNYRFKIDCYLKITPYISGIDADVWSIMTAKITNLAYGNRIDIADISDSIDDTIDNSEGYVLLSSDKYSQEFDVVGFAQQINLGLCEIRGRCQYDLSIPNENDINGTLMVQGNVILQQKISGVWSNFSIINLPFQVTRVTNLYSSTLLYGDFIGSSLQIFDYIPIGTYRLKTELRLWRNTSIPRANQLVSNVHLDLSNIYQSKLSYNNYFSVWIKDIGFNISDYQSTETAQINFTTGAIAGEDYLFEIDEVTPDTSRTYIKDEVTYTSGYRLKCLKSDADVEATGLAIPNTFKQGQAGDKFILLNINMPYNPYVLNAEERLETYVKAELDKVCDAKRAFSIEIYDPFISSFAETDKLITGNYIKIKHTNLIGSGSTATVQIKGITITQSKGDMFPKFTIILSEESSITRPTITRGGGIIGDLYRRYRDLGDRFDNVTRNVSTLNTNLGRTIDVDTFNNNYIQVRGVNKEINALALSAKTTADEKNKCWTIKPTPPYYKGDQWLVDAGDVGSTGLTAGDVLFCNTIRETGDFNLADWGGNRYIGEKEVNELIDDFSVQVIGEKPIGKTVFGKGDSLETTLNEVSLKVNNKTRIELNELPDGERTLFTASKIFLAGTADVYVNRLKQYKGFDYTEATANSILFAVAPKTEDVLVLEAVENTNNENIVFADSAVKALCATNWGSDGEITYAQAAAVTDLGSVFTGNSTIISFDELQYFNSLKSLEYGNFGGCLNLTSIIIPNSVTSIANEVFPSCQALTSIIIPNSVTSIGNNAFQDCQALASIIIPNSVTSIGNNAFQDCQALASIIIPNSVTSIGDGAFDGCTGLTSITIPNSVTSIGEYAFDDCAGLTSITIPNSVTSIGDYAFTGCSSLTSITIPNSVTSIGEGVFDTCTGLTSITIPNSVTSIGDYAFIGCSSLTSITIEAITPPTLGADTFLNNINLSHIYVPNASVDAYKAASGWSDYADIISQII